MARTKTNEIRAKYNEEYRLEWLESGLTKREFSRSRLARQIRSRKSSALYRYRLKKENEKIVKSGIGGDDVNVKNWTEIEKGAPYFKALSYGHDDMGDPDAKAAINEFEMVKKFNAGKMRAIIDATETGGGRKVVTSFHDYQRAIRRQYKKSRKRQKENKDYTSDFADVVSISTGDIGDITYLLVKISR